jgi:ELWxxDGT repeat protein
MWRLLFIAVALLPLPAWSQTASLTRDINILADDPLSSYPSGMLAAGGKLFFSAAEDGSGSEPWVSDGTPAGTQMLGDLCPGTCSSSPIFLGSAGDVAVFSARADYVHGRQGLWRSDGTRAGTFLLPGPDGEPLLPDSEEVAFLDGALLFRGCRQDYTCQLWRSDGTPAGTGLVADAVPDALIAGAGKVWFLSETGESALWATDGTAAGTARVREFPGSSLSRLTGAGNRLFFTSFDGDGAELWTSDGTAAGTLQLTHFVPDTPFREGLRAFGNHVYFVADDVVHGAEIWRSDGTPESTRRVTEFGFHAPFEYFEEAALSLLAEMGNRLLFAATDGLAPTRLWTTAGAPESTAPLPCNGPCPTVSGSRLLPVGGRVLFAATDDDHGRELWSTDGTAAGTRLILDVCPGYCDGLYDDPVPLLGTALFLAEPPSSSNGYELWTSDGAPAGTRPFADPRSGVRLFDSLSSSTAIGSTLFFAGASDYGVELWASDGTPAGTRLVTDLAHGGPASEPQELTPLAGRLFFTACDGTNQELWQTAGPPETTKPVTSAGHFVGCFGRGTPQRLTAAGPWLFYWIETGPESTLWRTDGTAPATLALGTFPIDDVDHLALAAFGNRIFFTQPGTGSDPPVQWDLWESDGTGTGTKMSFTLPADAGNPGELTTVGPEMYFVGNRPDFSQDLWRTDGTLAGTRKLTAGGLSFRTGPAFTRVGPVVYFVAEGELFPELWKTDGTSAGTVRVRGDLLDLRGRELAAYQGALYFFFDDPYDTVAPALWRSDGTEAGTVPVREFAGAFESGEPTGLTILGDRLYFAADDGDHGRELWASDGTAAGTALVRDIFPGAAGSQPTGLRAAGGRLFFSAGDDVHGFELWQSDGTAAGTRMVQDLAPWGASSYPERLTPAGDRLYFSADDRLHGREVWTLPLAGPGGCQPSPDRLCLGNGRFQVEAAWRDFQGATGSGRAVSLTADTGYFWFFDPANVEVVLKVLDGRALNEHFWVFYGALSSVEYTLTVTDTSTGATRRYFNPAGTFASVGDTRGFGPLGAYSVARRATPAPAAPRIEERTDPAAATPACQPAAARLCLNGGRFAVEASWKDFQGKTGTGTAVALTGDTGYFWFFDPANVETVLKVLDGRPLNGKFWVFYGALSSVEYTLTVTDTETGTVRTYRNLSGRFASVGDTGAF